MAKTLGSSTAGIKKKVVGEAYRGKHAEHASEGGKGLSAHPKLPTKVPEKKTGAPKVSPPKKDYYQRLVYTRQRSQYNKNVNTMAAGGMLRSRILMRYLDKPRFMVLMEKMTKQLQNGDNGWIGSLHSIIKLIRLAVQKNQGHMPKFKEAKPVDTKKYETKPHKPQVIKAKKLTKSFVDFDQNPCIETADELMDSVWGFIEYVKSNSEYVPQGVKFEKAKVKPEETSKYMSNLFENPLSMKMNSPIHKSLGKSGLHSQAMAVSQYLSQPQYSYNSRTGYNAVHAINNIGRQYYRNKPNPFEGHEAAIALASMGYHKASEPQQKAYRMMMRHYFGVSDAVLKEIINITNQL